MTEAPANADAWNKPDQTDWLQSIPMLFVHVWAIWAVIHTGFHLKLALWALGSTTCAWSASPPATTATSRTAPSRPVAADPVPARVLAPRPALQKGVLWWAAHHRQHHKLLRQPSRTCTRRSATRLLVEPRRLDPLARSTTPTDYERVKDLAEYPELRLA